MAGAEFVRADLHVHLTPDKSDDPADPAPYVATAIAQGIRVLGITDHNQIRGVRQAVAAATGTGVVVLPGLEVTTHQGHLLALFAPEGIPALEAFAVEANLRLSTDITDGSRRSDRSLLDLVGEVHERGGLAILAHVDSMDGGLSDRVSLTELRSLLTHPGLAAVEFVNVANLRVWFNSGDSDATRRAAGEARQAIPELAERGLARVMSSDAHDASLVGKEGVARKLTRIRLDEANFESVANALLNNPKARCKVEASLPDHYPRVISARFEGGFLDNVSIDFSPNLNALIGGRGSGKSTVLIALRAALGEPARASEDPDDPVRMPGRTIVEFQDSLGVLRTSTRDRGGRPTDALGPIRLKLVDLGQDEFGELARSYDNAPELLLSFLDGFCDLTGENAREEELIQELNENARVVEDSNFSVEDIEQLDETRRTLIGTLDAAQTGRLEEVVDWARALASQGTLIANTRTSLTTTASPRVTPIAPSVAEIAARFDVDLTRPPVSGVLTDLETAIGALNDAARLADDQHKTSIAVATAATDHSMNEWQAAFDDLMRRLLAKQEELTAEGLKVEAGEAKRIAEELAAVAEKLTRLRERQTVNRAALGSRRSLLLHLSQERGKRYQRRRAAMRSIADRLNDVAGPHQVSVYFREAGDLRPWIEWLRTNARLRSPRVDRLAVTISPPTFAQLAATGSTTALTAVVDTDGDGRPFLSDAVAEELLANFTWKEQCGLETMRLDDLPRIELFDRTRAVRRSLNQVSAGQQRAALLSVVLGAAQTHPLIIDQPEDHLDAPYIASTLVAHLEAVKERRQVIVATHSANLTVLGDAELVIPMYADDGRGTPADMGSVDSRATRAHVCGLLEGGVNAYRRRGERYGFRFSFTPTE